jgi:hypothetical protein
LATQPVTTWLWLFDFSRFRLLPPFGPVADFDYFRGGFSPFRNAGCGGTF